MSAWSGEIRACKTTWSTLLALGQMEAPFPDAGAIPMTQLTFWTSADTGRDVRARALATEMDGLFTHVRGATYEDGVTQPAAVAAVTASLLTESGTVADLSGVCDTQYHFRGETEAGAVEAAPVGG